MTPADLAALLSAVTRTVVSDHGLDASLVPDSVVVERPRLADHGDYSTNVALQLGKKLGVNPRELAGWLADAFSAADGIDKAEVAGPGFVNIWLAAAAQNSVIETVLTDTVDYGRGDEFSDKTINLEFVSANPTGPIHLGGCLLYTSPSPRD